MIAVPQVPSFTTSKDSSSAADQEDMMMHSAEEWPSLSASLGQPTTPAPAAVGSSGDGDDWEMLSPDGVSAEEEPADNSVVVVKTPPHPQCLMRKNSVSAPDLRELEEAAAASEESEQEDDVSSSVVMVSSQATDADTAASGSVVVVPHRNHPWGNDKNKVSFKDAILAPSKHAHHGASGAAKKKKHHGTTTDTGGKSKFKTRFVVTPIKRCAKSTGDLLSLAEQEHEEEEDLLPMGETDAIEYYQRKSHGAHGRTNGLKQRPDEAKRKEMIVNKKNMQRQQQGK